MIEPGDVSSPEAVRLLAACCAEIDAIYGNTEPMPPEIAGIDEPGAAFVLARENERAVGCGAIRPHTAAIAEVKRMYVEPPFRRRGIARLILEKLEKIARSNGFEEIRLETGQWQPGAMRLYESMNYAHIPGFGEFKDDPLNACYGKKLA